jgi:hypothetical protein
MYIDKYNKRFGTLTGVPNPVLEKDDFMLLKFNFCAGFL